MRWHLLLAFSLTFGWFARSKLTRLLANDIYLIKRWVPNIHSQTLSLILSMRSPNACAPTTMDKSGSRIIYIMVFSPEHIHYYSLNFCAYEYILRLRIDLAGISRNPKSNRFPYFVEPENLLLFWKCQ